MPSDGDDHTSSDATGADRIVVVVTVLDDRDAAEGLAASVVDQHLAACTQLEGPLLSTYRWQGELCRDEEWRVSAKTTADRAESLMAALAAEHPYEVPEILVMPVSGGHEPYMRWVAGEVRTR